MKESISIGFAGWVVIPLLGFVAAMVLVGLKQREFYFKPAWSVIFLYNLAGAALFVLGVMEINQPGWWPTLSFDAISEDTWKIMGLTFFLFPISFLVTLARLPFRLLGRRREPAR